MDKIVKHLKRCILEIQGTDKINYEQAAVDIRLPKSTLFSIFEEDGNPTLRNLKKIMDFSGCYVKCTKTRRKKCVERAKKYRYKDKKAA